MQTKQSKFPFGWVFASIAALIVGTLIFFSFNFQHFGNKLTLSIIGSFIITVLLLGIVYMLARVKKVAVPLNFRKAAIIEIGLLIAYFVVIIVAICFFNHFFVVMSKTDDIKQEVEKQINQIDDMFSSYQKNVDNRVTAYDKYLQMVEMNRDANYTLYINERLNQYKRTDLVINFKSEIDCGDVRQEKQEWKTDMLNKTNGLGLITLMPRVNEINENLNKTLVSLKSKDHTSERGLNGSHWNYTLTVSNNLPKYFEKQKGEPLNIWAFLVSIVAAIIILLPYIAAERDGRNRGLLWEITHNRETASHNEKDSPITGI